MRESTGTDGTKAAPVASGDAKDPSGAAAARTAFVRRLHDRSGAGVLAVAGAGSSALAALLNEPGASRTVLNARVPYAAGALSEYLCYTPEQAASELTARRLAMAAFQEARRLQPDARFGIGCAAALVTDSPRRGDHRIHVALQSPTRTTALSVVLHKAARDRAGEEAVAQTLILNAVAEALGLADRLPVPLLPAEQLRRRARAAPDAWRQLLVGSVDRVATRDGAVLEPEPRGAPVLFPGAFNPLHDGHRGMAQVTRHRLGQPPAYEICVFNVDKPPLDYLDVADRLRQFQSGDVVWLTHLPTFVEKARWQPGCTFVVGIDTLERIAQPRYYGDDRRARDAAIRELVEHNVRFLVFGRRLRTDFMALHDVDLPPELLALCDPVTETDFRADVSSTALRSS